MDLRRTGLDALDGRAIALCFLDVLLSVAKLAAIVVMARVVADLGISGSNDSAGKHGIAEIALMSAILGLLALVGALVVLTLPQLFQFLLVIVLRGRFSDRAHLMVLAVLPITAAIACYAYESFIPAIDPLGINAGADWIRPRRGTALSTYLAALAVQVPITLYTLWHLHIRAKKRSPTGARLTAIAIAIVAGSTWGYR